MTRVFVMCGEHVLETINNLDIHESVEIERTYRTSEDEYPYCTYNVYKPKAVSCKKEFKYEVTI